MVLAASLLASSASLAQPSEPSPVVSADPAPKEEPASPQDTTEEVAQPGPTEVTASQAAASANDSSQSTSAEATPETTASHAPPTPSAASPQAAVEEAPRAPTGDAHDAGDHALANDKSRFRMGKGLALESEDGDFALIPRLRAQFRYSWSKAEDADAEHLVQIRRARLGFSGHVYGKNNKFKAELAVSPRDVGMRNGAAPTTSPLLDFYFNFSHLRDLTLRVGQYKVPFNRQRLVSSGNLQMVDRSIINSEFNLDRDLGLDVRSKDLFGVDMFRYYLGIFAGEGRNKNVADKFAMMYLARFEFLPLGMFRDFSEGDQKRIDKPKLAFGVAYGHVENAKKNKGIGGSTPADGGTTDVDAVTWDAIFKYAGFSLQTEWAWRKGSRQPGAAEDEDGNIIAEEAPRDGLGGMVQAGYLFPRSRFEVAARAGSIWSGEDSSLEDQEEFGGAISYYFARHPFKLQADYFHLRESADNRENWDSSDNIRVQLQASY